MDPSSFTRETIKTQLFESFEQFVKAAHPAISVKNHLPQPPAGRTLILGAGKASAAMAAAFEQHYPAPVEGLIITRDGHSYPTKQVKVVEAAHPVPDERGQKAVAELITLAEAAGPDDLIVCLISGGGSALLSAPVAGVSFPEIQALTKALLASGAEIDEINCVRKHLNQLLGGGLAKHLAGKSVLTLAISDVIGDDPGTIASGPTVADATTLAAARAILTDYDITPAAAITAALNNTANETPKPGDQLFDTMRYELIATPALSLEAADEFWHARGFETIIYNPEVGGDTNEAAKQHVHFLRQHLEKTGPLDVPLAILSGGETTVKLTGSGEGGPNTQFMLQAALSLAGQADIYGLAADSDGYDGSADNAGAWITPETLANAAAEGLDAARYLANNDSYNFFKPLQQLVQPGATHTNVNDYRVFLILPS